MLCEHRLRGLLLLVGGAVRQRGRRCATVRRHHGRKLLKFLRGVFRGGPVENSLPRLARVRRLLVVVVVVHVVVVHMVLLLRLCRVNRQDGLRPTGLRGQGRHHVLTDPTPSDLGATS